MSRPIEVYLGLSSHDWCFILHLRLVNYLVCFDFSYRILKENLFDFFHLLNWVCSCILDAKWWCSWLIYVVSCYSISLRGGYFCNLNSDRRVDTISLIESTFELCSMICTDL